MNQTKWSISSDLRMMGDNLEAVVMGGFKLAGALFVIGVGILVVVAGAYALRAFVHFLIY